jgi:hypothetical protein
MSGVKHTLLKKPNGGFFLIMKEDFRNVDNYHIINRFYTLTYNCIEFSERLNLNNLRGKEYSSEYILLG